MPTEEAPAPVRKRRRYLRISLIVLVVLVVLGGAGALAGGLYLHSIEKTSCGSTPFRRCPSSRGPSRR
jgi:flagellar basal body-associated protein FliL